MQHICHITTGHPPFDTRVFKRECVSLAKAGFKVTLLAQHDREEVVDGVNIHPLKKYSGFVKEKFIAPQQAIKIARSINADLYHFHDPELVPWMAKLASQISKPIVWDAHEDYVSTISHFNKFKIRRISRFVAEIFGYLERKSCLERFAGVVTVTDTMARRYLDLGLKTCVLENVPDLSNIKRAAEDQRFSTPLFVSTGYQFKDRGIFEIAEAFNNLSARSQFQIAYWGSFENESLRDELRQRAGSLNSQRVFVEGPVEWKRLVNDLLPQAWASFVLFNTQDRNNCVGLPNRFFESWAASVPVIATAGTEVAKIVEAKGGGIVVPSNDPKHLESAMVRFAHEPDLVHRMGVNARRAVDEEFNWAAAFERLILLYASFGIRGSLYSAGAEAGSRLN